MKAGASSLSVPSDPRELRMLHFLSVWGLVEADFQERYGIDLGEPGLLRSRSWRWLRARTLALLSTESRVQRVLAPQKPPEPSSRGRSEQ